MRIQTPYPPLPTTHAPKKAMHNLGNTINIHKGRCCVYRPQLLKGIHPLTENPLGLVWKQSNFKSMLLVRRPKW